MGLRRDSLKACPREKKSMTLQKLFDLDSPRNGASKLARSSNGSPRKECQDSENEEIFSLIPHCSVFYTFNNPQESPSQQDLKRLKLIQLLSIIKCSKTAFSREVLSLPGHICRLFSTSSTVCS
nr:uncharacterized protein LOC113708481 [Coffea arabica]